MNNLSKKTKNINTIIKKIKTKNLCNINNKNSDRELVKNIKEKYRTGIMASGEIKKIAVDTIMRFLQSQI